MSTCYERALAHLCAGVGCPTATFHDGQWEAIRALIEDRARLLVVQRTGWGKSMVYFISTKLQREMGMGPTLILSPLLALMRNQVEAARRLGLNALTYNSAQTPTDQDKAAIGTAVQRGEVDLLLVSPETLFADHFRDNVLQHANFGLLVVDEAHCISDWGHDFRTDYRRIVTLLRQIPRNTPVLATTATANNRVVDDVKKQLGANLGEIRGPLLRTSLRLQTLELPTQPQRLAWLAAHLPRLRGSGIVYVRTQRDAERVAEWLSQKGMRAAAYHSRLRKDSAENAALKMELEDKLLNNTLDALVATSALGMGFDKPDLGFVVHYQRPGSVVEYYQQVGRAGRDGNDACGLLMSGDEDDDITRYFIERAHPPLAHVEQVLEVLDAADGPTTPKMLTRQVGLSESRIKSVLDILHALSPSPVRRGGNRWERTAVPYRHDPERIEALKQIRYDEQEKMRAYMDSDRCLQQVLCEELNDPHAVPCGRCAVCEGQFILPTDVSPALVKEAATFLRSRAYMIEPRKQWPGAHLALTGTTSIPESHRAQEGRALGTWRDGAWGEQVYDGKYRHGHFDDALVEAAVHLVRDVWRPPVEWVTCVPSLQRPDLVPSFAKRLADRLGLPFHACIEKVEDTPPQKQMANSTYQVKNIKDAFEVHRDFPAGRPVLLVDDLVDSKWTFTVLAARLTDAGAGLVYPFALASAASGS